MKREASLQTACVQWFNLQYPQYGGLLIHVPNGGSRNRIEARNMKRQGVTAGVADLLLLIPRHAYGCLCIEMKVERGRQSEAQERWEKQTQRFNMYIICRTIEQFIDTINFYLCGK
ncbi:MAG: VRR-NUC domain-containing protein [Prevotellaceae bacterium]|jgi:hypothetical protein|nr:VRR-NUC domain-containing protein [Prevotellaceae bacterium]